jgi:hypothetical protein
MELLDETPERYTGYEEETRLTINGCVILVAQHLRLISVDETGLGWGRAELCDLSDRVRVSIEYDPGTLDAFPKEVQDLLFEKLNLNLG